MGGLEPFGSPEEKKKKKTKCIYSRAEKKAAQSSVFFMAVTARSLLESPDRNDTAVKRQVC